jgi:hypothetical protein
MKLIYGLTVPGKDVQRVALSQSTLQKSLLAP